MTRALGKFERAGITVVGLQEMEDPQAKVIEASGTWQVHRATPNNRFPDGNTMFNAIAWDTAVWSLVGTDEISYNYGAQPLHLPIVHLVGADGTRITVIDVHNPAGGSAAAARKVGRDLVNARAAQLALQAPVIVTGDFNERAPALCGLLPATGGTGCSPRTYCGVDWVFSPGPP